jgi:hypothetical protein
MHAIACGSREVGVDDQLPPAAWRRYGHGYASQPWTEGKFLDILAGHWTAYLYLVGRRARLTLWPSTGNKKIFTV